LLCDVVDAAGKVLEAATIAVDTVGAGVGDKVIITCGSAARMPSPTIGAPVDAAIIAVVDQVSVAANK
jgi:microcompartment protein CcmK/EutM